MSDRMKNKLSHALKTHCESCRICHTERKPESVVSRILKWHKTWCPAWRAYQRYLEEEGQGEAEVTTQET